MRYNRAGVWSTPALSAIFIWCNLEEKANMKKFLTLLLALVMALCLRLMKKVDEKLRREKEKRTRK